MHYETVFDIASAGYKEWTFAAFGLILAAAGVVQLFARRLLPASWGPPARWRKVFAWVFLGFGVTWTAAAFGSTYLGYRALAGAVRENRAQVVEGRVGDFRPLAAQAHGQERFCVNGKCFFYSDYLVSAGFNQTTAHGGPIREGLPVRVTYVGNDIVKLEVAR